MNIICAQWMSLGIFSCICCVTAACEDHGWFGSQCQYKCHCQNKSCDTNGLCDNGVKCERGWFGPQCQYQDLSVTTKAQFKPEALRSVLSDGDDTTCSGKPAVHAVSVNLQDVSWITWIRLSYNDPVSERSNLYEINLEFKVEETDTSTVKCDDGKKYVDKECNIIDIKCDLNVEIAHITISGEIVGSLCSIYISGGRNLALKQHVTQSSTFSDSKYVSHPFLNETSASNAVDGNTNSAFIVKSCTHTDIGDKNPHWNLTFSRAQFIQRYILYNRNEHMYRLRKFQMNSFFMNDLVFNYTGPEEDKREYVISTREIMKPVDKVQIHSTFVLNKDEHVLTLCEVEAYGDPYCEGHTFGLDCLHACNCADEAEECLVATGGCVSGCASGYQGQGCEKKCHSSTWGKDCSVRCHINCKNDTCHHVTGQCEAGCQSGFTGPDCSQSENNPGAAAAIAVCLFVVAAAICLAAVFIFKRYKTSQQWGNSSIKQTLTSREISIDDDQTADQLDQSEASDNYMTFSKDVAMSVKTLIEVTRLQQFLRSHDNSYFEEQFKIIPHPSNVTQYAGLSSENIQKNRYKDICTYDHSRVHLEINTINNEGDYINASFIEGYKNDERMIACQGPKASMVNDFVRMLWEQKVEKVVMLTNLTEEGKRKCERYWPEDGSHEFGSITVTLTTTQIFADYTIRRLQLTKKGQGSQHITQYHFTSWPDKGVPLTPWGLVDFEQRVFDQPSINPLVVHCSAGVGRTGTFIALRIIMREAEDTGNIDFFNTVAKLRQSRMKMVQTHEQYKFLHMAALVAIAFMGTTITAADIEERIATLEMNFGTGTSQMEKEFEAVCTISEDVSGTDTEREHADDVIYQNNAGDTDVKDRFSSVRPCEMYRATLETDTKNMGDYINAVLVPSFTRLNNYILTQIPLPTTVVDFWRLVTQYEAKLVLAFELVSTDNETFGNYLPSKTNESLVYQQFVIDTEPSDRKGFCEEQNVTVKMKKNKGIKRFYESNVHTLIHLKCSISDYDPKNLLTIIPKARGIMARQKGRVVFVCRNGATYSGLACVLTILLDRMDNDLRLTVPLVVGAIKSIRPEVIPTLNQYRLLYQILQRYNETSASYTNFTAKSAVGRTVTFNS